MITEYKLYLSLVLSQPDLVSLRLCYQNTQYSRPNCLLLIVARKHKTICSAINYGRLGSDLCKATDRALLSKQCKSYVAF